MTLCALSIPYVTVLSYVAFFCTSAAVYMLLLCIMELIMKTERYLNLYTHNHNRYLYAMLIHYTMIWVQSIIICNSFWVHVTI